LIFNVVRSIEDGWSYRVSYPELDPTQKEKIQELVGLLSGSDIPAIDLAFHRACYTLFAHRRHQYPTSRVLDKFFSPVNAFVVYISIREDGTFKKAGDMTQGFAALIYAIRTTMVIETVDISKRKDIDVFEYICSLHFRGLY
jgi:hypothetical protein